MFNSDEGVNYILSYSKTLVDNLNIGKNVPTSLTEHICVELPEYDNNTSVKLYKINN